MTITECTKKLLPILDKHDMSDKERKYRREQLCKAETLKTENLGGFSDRYYQLAHEIRCIDFLAQFGKPKLSSDADHNAGADIVLGEYQIECVCASPGSKTAENGFDRLCVKNNLGGNLVNYDEREEIVLSRLTSVLKEKRDFFLMHCAKNSMSKDKPYIVFVGLGALVLDYSAGDNGIEFVSILFGKGNPTITIDAKGNVIEKGFAHRSAIVKRTGDRQIELPCNLFLDESYSCISGILFSEDDVSVGYNLKNTWLFINPFADTPINTEIFPGLIYWDIDDLGYYRAYGNGSK